MKLHIELVPLSDRLPDPKVDSHVICFKALSERPLEIHKREVYRLTYSNHRGAYVDTSGDNWSEDDFKLCCTHWLSLTKPQPAPAPSVVVRRIEDSAMVYVGKRMVYECIGNWRTSPAHRVAHNLADALGVEVVYE